MTRVSSPASARLRADYMRLKRDPVPYVVAEPLPSNILEWHYVVKGPEDSPYYGGYYHGKLVFPLEYPFRPPSIYMTTPSGRFKTGTRLCLSISDFHPDTWNPAWSVATILTGLLSFMLEKSPTLGSIESSDYEKKEFASRSLQFNIKNKIFTELFPDIVTEINQKLEEREKKMSEDKNESANGNLRPNPHLEDNAQQMSAVTNLFVLVGFAIFAWVVKFVLNGLAEDNG